MPYIKKEDRKKFNSAIDSLNPNNSGELNYVITRLAHNYIKEKGLRYANMNEVVGVIESAKLEFYRKVVAPYEEKKIEDNGDIEVIS